LFLILLLNTSSLYFYNFLTVYIIGCKVKIVNLKGDVMMTNKMVGLMVLGVVLICVVILIGVIMRYNKKIMLGKKLQQALAEKEIVSSSQVITLQVLCVTTKLIGKCNEQLLLDIGQLHETILPHKFALSMQTIIRKILGIKYPKEDKVLAEKISTLQNDYRNIIKGIVMRWEEYEDDPADWVAKGRNISSEVALWEEMMRKYDEAVFYCLD